MESGKGISKVENAYYKVPMEKCVRSKRLPLQKSERRGSPSDRVCLKAGGG